MSKRSMVRTSPDKMEDIEQKNPENKDPQSVQTNSINSSAVKYGQNSQNSKK